MSMKQQIMEKLFAEQPLTNEEILLIGSRLDDTTAPKEEKKTRRKKTDPLPFNHDRNITVSKACSLTNKDFENINALINSEIKEKKYDMDSKIIEVYERIGLAKPQNFRLLMYQFVKMKNALTEQQNSVVRGVGGIGFGGNFNDFLDFLRGRKPE